MRLTIRGEVELVDKDDYTTVLKELHAGEFVEYLGHEVGGNVLVRTDEGEEGVIGAAGTEELF